MGNLHKATPNKTVRIRPRAAAKHEEPMTNGERARMIAAAANFLGDQDDYDYDYESEEQDLLEAEAEVARFLGRVSESD